MFYNANDFPFLLPFIQNADLISKEFEEQVSSPELDNFLNASQADISTHVDYWIKEGGFAEEQIGYDARDGSWAAFPLYKKGFPIKWYDVKSTFPTIYSLLENVPELNFSALFRIAPNSGSKEHTHSQSNLIFHLCLSDPDGESVMRCNGEEKIISKKGDYILFDYSKPHSSFNYGKKDRINLIIDFTPKK